MITKIIGTCKECKFLYFDFHDSWAGEEACSKVMLDLARIKRYTKKKPFGCWFWELKKEKKEVKEVKVKKEIKLLAKKKRG
jgi:hypothetical protein